MRSDAHRVGVRETLLIWKELKVCVLDRNGWLAQSRRHASTSCALEASVFEAQFRVSEMRFLVRRVLLSVGSMLTSSGRVLPSVGSPSRRGLRGLRAGGPRQERAAHALGVLRADVREVRTGRCAQEARRGPGCWGSIRKANCTNGVVCLLQL